MKISTIISLMLIFSGATGTAGVIHGGGGTSVICRDSNGKIRTAEVLDIYEARSRGLTLISAGDLVDYYRLFMTRYLEYRGARPLPESNETLRNYINNILNSNYTFYTLPGQKLPPTNDYTAPVVPSGCEIEQLAIFDRDPVYKLVLDTEIWNSLDDRNKMALLAHEMIYQSDRSIWGVTNSDNVRRLVGLFFSTTPPARNSSR